MAKGIQGLPPGWVWEYHSGGGYKGRHAYNIVSGDAMAVRDVRNIAEHKRTYEQVLERINSNPIEKQHTKLYAKTRHEIREFRTLDGAMKFAHTRLSPGTRVFVTAHAFTTEDKKYQDETNKPQFLSLSSLSTVRAMSDATIHERASHSIVPDGRNRYYVNAYYERG